MFVGSHAASFERPLLSVDLSVCKSSHSETRTRINYPCGPFKHTLFENQLLRLTSLGEEAFCCERATSKFGQFFTTSACHTCLAACSAQSASLHLPREISRVRQGVVQCNHTCQRSRRLTIMVAYSLVACEPIRLPACLFVCWSTRHLPNDFRSQREIFQHAMMWYAVAVWYGAGLAITR